MRLNYLIFIAALFFPHYPLAAASDLWPSQEHSPQDVVNIVIKALKDNNSDTDDGISVVYRFASPGNKANTGPIERFTRMIKLGFSDMLNHRFSRFDEMRFEGKTALQPVFLTTRDGREVGYLFQVGEQTIGEYKGMWMTEAVYPIPVTGQTI